MEIVWSQQSGAQGAFLRSLRQKFHPASGSKSSSSQAHITTHRQNSQRQTARNFAEQLQLSFAAPCFPPSPCRAMAGMLVGGWPTPLKKYEFVSWNYYPQYMEKKMFQTTNQYGLGVPGVDHISPPHFGVQHAFFKTNSSGEIILRWVDLIPSFYHVYPSSTATISSGCLSEFAMENGGLTQNDDFP